MFDGVPAVSVSVTTGCLGIWLSLNAPENDTTDTAYRRKSDGQRGNVRVGGVRRKVPVKREEGSLTETVDADLDNHFCEWDWVGLVTKREKCFLEREMRKEVRS